MPYNTRYPIRSTLNTGTNLSGIVSFMNSSLFHLARGIKLIFHFGRKMACEINNLHTAEVPN